MGYTYLILALFIRQGLYQAPCGFSGSSIEVVCESFTGIEDVSTEP